MSASPAARPGRPGRRRRPSRPALAALALALAGAFGPFAPGGPDAFGALGAGPASWLAAAWAGCMALALAGGLLAGAALGPLALAGAFLALLAQRGLDAGGAWGYWASFWGFLLAALVAVGTVSLRALEPDAPALLRRVQRFLPAGMVPLLVLLVWEGLVVGFRVPKGIFPRVSDIWSALLASWPVLLDDSYVTFVKEVLLGFGIGLTTGYLAGVAISASRFLQRGFLPLATAFGAVPIVGLAPVLGRAFGVDWQSKAAVVVIVTFFPVVLNTVQGLTRVDPLRLELLRAYAATPRQVFLALRLPNSLPFVFNALKISVVVAIVSVIVAEFLIPGPPNGLGQRISLSAHRGAFDVVFAAILVSSLISMALYALITVLERLTTSWHPSARGS